MATRVEGRGAAAGSSGSGGETVVGPRGPRGVEARIERLSTASLKRVIEPDEAVPGSVGDGAVLPPELLSVAGLGLDLTPEQLRILSREEIASIVDNGIRFEALLTAGFGLDISRRRDLTDPRVVYMLHEVGEESRHSRLFARLLGQLRPTARNPLVNPVTRFLDRAVLTRLLTRPAFFCVLVLTGEEIPDLLQKLAGEHPDTDPFIREVNRYHRQEEARHLAFARMLLPEAWRDAGWIERRLIAHLAPVMIKGIFETLVHPGVYATVGLPTWATWKAANRTPQRVGLRHQALRPVLRALRDGGAFRAGVPRGWQELCGVDRAGRPVAAAATVAA